MSAVTEQIPLDVLETMPARLLSPTDVVPLSPHDQKRKEREDRVRRELRGEASHSKAKSNNKTPSGRKSKPRLKGVIEESGHETVLLAEAVKTVRLHSWATPRDRKEFLKTIDRLRIVAEPVIDAWFGEDVVSNDGATVAVCNEWNVYGNDDRIAALCYFHHRLIALVEDCLTPARVPMIGQGSAPAQTCQRQQYKDVRREMKTSKANKLLERDNRHTDDEGLGAWQSPILSYVPVRRTMILEDDGTGNCVDVLDHLDSLGRIPNFSVDSIEPIEGSTNVKVVVTFDDVAPVLEANRSDVEMKDVREPVERLSRSAQRRKNRRIASQNASQGLDTTASLQPVAKQTNEKQHVPGACNVGPTAPGCSDKQLRPSDDYCPQCGQKKNSAGDCPRCSISSV